MTEIDLHAKFRARYAELQLEVLDFAGELWEAGRFAESEEILADHGLCEFDLYPVFYGALHPTWATDRARLDSIADVVDLYETDDPRFDDAAAYARDELGVTQAEVEALQRLAAAFAEEPQPLTGGPMTVTLPDGTDTTDPKIRAKVDARSHEMYGPHSVVLWPRYPDTIDGLPTIIPVVDSRPAATTHHTTAKASDAPRLAAVGRAQGLGELVEFIPERDIATYAKLSELTTSVRARIAEVVRVEPWDVEVAVAETFDEKLGRDRIDQVVILRAKALAAMTADRRANTIKELVGVLPDGSTGWAIWDDPVSGQVRLAYGAPRTLPTSVDVADILPAEMRQAEWNHVPLGLDDAGQVVAFDLALGPHVMCAGPTNSGKSVLLRTDMASRIARGHRLAVVETSKGCVDFVAFDPWIVAMGETLESGRNVLQAVYAEGERRREILKIYAAPNWRDLDEETRVKHGFYPLSVYVDEFVSMVKPRAVPDPKALGADHPAVQEAQTANADKALILDVVGRISRELRFTGIFMEVAGQRFDANSAPGISEMRANWTSAVQVIKPGTIPAVETLRMVMPGDQTAEAERTFRELDDGKSPGIGGMATEGGTVTGFRVAYAPPAEIVGHLERIGVPHVEKWAIEDTQAQAATEKFAVIEDAESDDSLDIVPVIELDVADLDADDVELEIDLSDDIGGIKW